MYCLENIDRIQFTKDLMIDLFKLYEKKGESSIYEERFNRDDKILARSIIEEDVEAIGKLLGLNITPTRLSLLASLTKEYVPKNKDEQYLLNIKDLLIKIAQSKQTFAVEFREFEDLATVLYRDVKRVGFKKGIRKRGDTTREFSELSGDDQLRHLIKLYNDVKKEGKTDILTTISNFYVDFVKVEPFTDENHFMGLLVLYTIIDREFKVCRYDSFFELLNKEKEAFGLSLTQAFYDWENGLSQTDSLVRVFIRILLQMHKNVEIKLHEYEFTLTMNKTNNIEAIVRSGPQVFSKNDIREQAPLVSDSTINRTLNLLKEQGIIVSLGQGRSAKWQRVVEKPKEFSYDQLSLFND